jgi:uncharacterized 2Fe-2S/4Fe-4S cluster protein (DUF4445 family)
MDTALETPAGEGLGIAFDIGTTTVVGSLVDLKKGRTIKTHSLKNPQESCGEDVLSRIKAITEDPGLLSKLRDSIINACNEIIGELSGHSRSKKNEIKQITAAGNTVMEHIFLGVSPEPLGRVPYKPVFRDARELKARSAGLDVGPQAILYTFPIIGGFVGGDTVALILSLGLHKVAGRAEQKVLAIDIGTNSRTGIRGRPDRARDESTEWGDTGGKD